MRMLMRRICDFAHFIRVWAVICLGKFSQIRFMNTTPFFDYLLLFLTAYNYVLSIYLRFNHTYFNVKCLHLAGLPKFVADVYVGTSTCKILL